MRVVVLAASAFGLRCLEIVRSLPCCEVAGVVTAPRRFEISYRPGGVDNVLHADVEAYCRAAAIPVAMLRDGMSDPHLWDAVAGWRPDAFLVAGWYHVVPRRWRALAPAYGLHASLLPDYSGGAPLVWAILNGEPRTGITLFQLDDGVDSGPIVGQAATAIDEQDTIATVYERIETLGFDLLRVHLPALAAGTATLTSQDEQRRRRFPQRGPEDGRIDWRRTSRELYDFVRAQTRPYPGAFTTWQGQSVTVWRSRRTLPSSPAPCPGLVLSDADTTCVATGDGALELLDVRCGSRDMSGRELRSLVAAGTVFGA